MNQRSLHRASLAAILACVGAATSVTLADPTPTEDFGNLAVGTTTRTIALSTSQVFWYKFTLTSPVTAGGPGSPFLDIRTSNPSGTITDTEIALYDAVGNFATPSSSDDDDGPGLGSALSYGSFCSPRANPAAGTEGVGVAFDGRDGVLPAGTYWLVVSP